MSIRKRFDRTLYNQNDVTAKESIKKVLETTEYKIVPNSKKTGVDLFLYKDGEHLVNIECEIKRVWKSKDFPYESVQIPERKEKYAILDKPTIYVMFNDDQSSYLCIKSEDLLKSPKKEVPNKYVFKGELFFQVPLTSVKMNDIVSVVEEIVNAKK